jgi:hypothetical protein
MHFNGYMLRLLPYMLRGVYSTRNRITNRLLFQLLHLHFCGPARLSTSLSIILEDNHPLVDL